MKISKELAGQRSVWWAALSELLHNDVIARRSADTIEALGGSTEDFLLLAYVEKARESAWLRKRLEEHLNNTITPPMIIPREQK